MDKNPLHRGTANQSTATGTSASDRSPGIGHNSAGAAPEPENAGNQEDLVDLQILREILLGPMNEDTAARFADIAEQLKLREDEIARRETDLRNEIESVKAGLKQREEALDKKVTMVEADLAKREASLMAKVSKVEAELTKREDELAASLAKLGSDLDRCKAQSSQISTDLSDKLAKARHQHDITIRGIGYAITQLGNHVSQMGKAMQSDA